MFLTRLALIGALMAASPAQAEEVTVTIDNFTFAPPTLTVAAGTTVVWVNHDDIPHTVADAANPGTVKSPVLDTDESYRRTFDKPGTYRYFCSLHPHMQGTVVVH